MGAAENGAGEILRGPAGARGARAGRKMRHRRPHCGLYVCHGLSFQIEAPRWGGVSRAWDYGRRGSPSSGSYAAFLIRPREAGEGDRPEGGGGGGGLAASSVAVQTFRVRGPVTMPAP